MSQSKPCVLIADDDNEYRKMLHLTLSSLDFRTLEAETGTEAIRLTGLHKPDILILDPGLPDVDGTSVISSIREWSRIPVIVLSERSDAADVVEAFETGADDYVVKPFHMEILLARIKSALRNAHYREQGDSILRSGSICMDLVRHEVMISQKVIDLSPKEYDLLSYFMQHAGKMLTHRKLLKEIWGEAHIHDKQYLRVYVKQLRQKIEADPASPEYITTCAGVGYRFEEI